MGTYAPYNFVPLSDWVYYPSGWEKISHDLPLRNGVSGVIRFTVIAKSPLLIAGEQDGGREKVFQRLPDSNKFFIPGSTLRGMIRNVLEIATFSKMRYVDNRRFGLRDLSGGVPAYTKKITTETPLGSRIYKAESRSGWLAFEGGKWVLYPCEHARVEHEDLAKMSVPRTKGATGNLAKKLDDIRKKIEATDPSKGEKQNIVDELNKLFGDFNPAHPLNTDRLLGDMLNSRGRRKTLAEYRKAFNQGLLGFTGNNRTAQYKYSTWNSRGQALDIVFDTGATATVHPHNGKKLVYRKATSLGTGSIPGHFVFTGQPSPQKHMEFIFYQCADAAIEVPEDVMQGFLFIHAESEDWNYWRKKNRSEERIPVFYLGPRPDTVTHLGLAQMFKLPYTYSIHDAIAHSSTDHLNHAKPDFVESVFGYTHADNPEHGLKGRVSFSAARCVSGQKDSPVTVILNTPKPTYYPNYIRQKTDASGERLATNADGYKTLMNDDAELRGWNPELRGWKRYPARKYIAPASIPQSNVTSTLRPLQAGAAFEGTLRFHNLAREELGALAWAMTWGGNSQLLHSLGMGKPFGLGQVQVQIDTTSSELCSNGPDQNAEDPAGILETCRADFEHAMNAICAHWINTPQLRALLAMADPNYVSPHDLRYMELSQRTNEFQQAKLRNNSFVLPNYVNFDYSPRLKSTSSATVSTSGDRSSAYTALLNEVMATHKISKHDEALRSQPLAKAWQQLEESDSKTVILHAIRQAWQERGWWDNPPAGAARKAKAIYEKKRPDA